MNLRIGEGFVWIDGHKICEGSQDLFGNRGMELPVFEFKQPDGNIATIGDVNRAANESITRLLDTLANRFERRIDSAVGYGLYAIVQDIRAEKENWK